MHIGRIDEEASEVVVTKADGDIEATAASEIRKELASAMTLTLADSAGSPARFRAEIILDRTTSAAAWLTVIPFVGLVVMAADVEVGTCTSKLKLLFDVEGKRYRGAGEAAEPISTSRSPTRCAARALEQALGGLELVGQYDTRGR